MRKLSVRRKRVLLGAGMLCATAGLSVHAGGAGHTLELVSTIPWLALALGVYLSSPASVAEVRSKQHRSRAKTMQLAEVYRATTEALASAIAAKDTYEQNHVRRVQSICELVAREMGLAGHEIDGIGIAALVHDVGKLGVPEYILLKPGPLDPEEFGKIANHANVGAKVLENVDYPWNVTEMVRHHHERYDGTGYPDHLAGDKIPLGARIIAVAEVYDALVSDRCYKAGWSHRQAVEHIEKLSRSHFDPRVVSAFVKVESQVPALLCPDAAPETPALPGAPPRDNCAAHIIAQANRELLSLLEIGETLSSTLELDEVLALLAHRTRRLTEAATCVVYLVDESNPRELVARAAVGRHQDVLKGTRVRLGKGVTGKAAARLKPYVGSHDPNDLCLATRTRQPLDLKSCLVAPMASFGKLWGTINLYDDSSRAFSRDDLQTLASVAGRAALAVQNATAFESVRDSAMKDPVTGLYNGRYLRSYLEHEMSRAARSGDGLSVLGLDLENFKAVNDSFGHGKGDAVLRDVAAIFQRQLRDYDLAARNGGDEFVVVLPGTPAAEAARTGQRIQAEIEAYAERALGNSTVPLGVSVGVATYPDDAIDIDSLLARADAAMYRDKRTRKQAQMAA